MQEPFVIERSEGRPALFYLQPWVNRFPYLSAGFSTREGGISASPYHSLNCGLHIQDDSEAVIHNRKQIADTLHIPFEAWTCADQVHGSRVAVIDERHRGRGSVSLADAIPNTDGMVTSVKGIWLTAFFADCVPLYFIDPVLEVVGLAHAGWKGTVSDISGETVRTMVRKFGSKPEHIHAAIGPSIGSCCYEVDSNVLNEVRRILIEKGLLFHADECYTAKPDGKAMLNLREINRRLLQKEGILQSHIELTHLCTSCDTDTFFSHRKEAGRTGRMISWIGMDVTRGEGQK
jgi:polyphenol oxidase